MKVSRFGKNEIICDFTSDSQREMFQAITGGRKVRRQCSVIINIKAIHQVSLVEEPVSWTPDAKAVYDTVLARRAARTSTIKKIRGAYGNQKFDYEYKGIYDCVLEHQKVMYNVMTHVDVACVDSDPGTGKTAPYLMAIDKRISKGQVKKALIITLSTLKENVLAEMQAQVPSLRGVILDSSKRADLILNKKYKVKKYNADYDVYIASYELMRSIVDLFCDEYFQMVILDECHRIGSSTSKQTDAIITKFTSIPYKYILSGTIHANNLMSFYMPFKFLGDDILPFSSYDYFKNVHMRPVDKDGYVWVPKPGAKNEVQKIFDSVSVAFKKQDCLDLPDLIFETVYGELEGDQKETYTEFNKELVASISEMCSKCNFKGGDMCDMSCKESIEAKSALTLCGKLLQIASGFYINTRSKVDEFGRVHNESNTISFKCNPKIKLLDQVISSIPDDRKIIIWATRVHALDTLCQHIAAMYGKDSYLRCYGDDNAFDVVNRFRSGNERFVVANQTKMGVGHNVQFSEYQIFYMNSYSYIVRDQSIGRQHRQGQKNKVTVFDLIMKDTIEVKLLNALRSKGDLNINLSLLARPYKRLNG